MYDAIAELSGAAVPAALPAETATYSDVAKTVNGILKKSQNEDMLAQGVGRLVKMAGTDTILSNAYRDRPRRRGSKKKHSGAQVAWVPSGDTCPFCLMLASKGWQNQTVWGANNHSEHIHANCDCTYAVRFNNDLDVEGYDPDELRKEYYAAGRTQDERLNTMRRENYAKNKDKINAQKREAYAKRTGDQFLMYRKDSNPGIFSSFEEPMTKKHVHLIAEEMGLDPKAAKYIIDKSEEMIDKKVYGYTSEDGKTVTLYGPAFLNRETLVKTIGHENIHLMQVKQNGIVKTSEELIRRENEARESEERWWSDYVKNTGYRPGH